MAGALDHERVSIYPLDDDSKERLLQTARECVFNWSTQDGWPVGVVMSFLWKDGKFWITAGAHRHRISAVRRDPRVSVVVSGVATPHGKPAGTVTVKGRCIVHEDRATKDWFYREFAFKGNPDPDAVTAFIKRLDSPLRVVLEIVPEKWITFDGAKFAADTAGTLPEDQRGPPLVADTERLERELKARGLG